MSRKPESRDRPTASEIESLPVSLQSRVAPKQKQKQHQQQQTKPKPSKPTQQYSKEARQKKLLFSAALCTHLGINIGVKGPTAFELFMLYRALGGRKRR